MIFALPGATLTLAGIISRMPQDKPQAKPQGKPQDGPLGKHTLKTRQALSASTPPHSMLPTMTAAKRQDNPQEGPSAKRT